MKFLKKMFSYGVANLLSKFITFLILPIYTRWLSPDDYGQADLAYSMAGILVSLVFMEIWVALLRFVAEKHDSEKDISSICTVVFCISLVLILPYILFQSIAGVFIGPQYTLCACLYGVSHYYKNTEQYLVRGRGHSRVFIISGLITSIGQLIIAYVLVKNLGYGANSILIAPAVGNVLAILFMEACTRNYKLIDRKTFDKTVARNIVLFAAPLSVNSLAFWAMNNINKFFAAAYLGYRESGFITVAAKLTMVLSLITSVFTLAWQESTFESSGDKNRGIKYREMSIAYLYVFTIGTILFMLMIAVIFPYYIGEEFYDAYSIVPFYFGAVYFSGLSAFFGTIFGAEKLTNKLMLTTIVGMVVNVLLVFATITSIGLMVIPICAALGNFACMLSRYRTISKMFDLGIRLYDVILMWGLLAFFIALSYLVTETLDRIILTAGAAIALGLIGYLRLVRNSNIMKSVLKNY